MTTPASPAPEVGDTVLEWNYALDRCHTMPRKVIAVINKGIYGWIVELDNHRMIEVRPLDRPHVFTEFSPEERNGKYKGHST